MRWSHPVEPKENAMNTDRSTNCELADAELDGISAASYYKVDMAKLLAYKGETCPKDDVGTGAMGAALNYIDTMMKW
jgi:hypothetical protein